MSKDKYKVWLHIEKINEDEDLYEELEEHVQSVGPEFDKEQEAIDLKEDIVDYIRFILSCDSAKLDTEKTLTNSCPKCKGELAKLHDGRTVCLTFECGYWRDNYEY